MKALVVGLGSAGRRHARNWAALRLGEVMVCRQTNSPQPEPLGVEARTFTNLDEALEAGPDVVLISNPTSLHVETALAAVRAGCHVLIEKPVGAVAGPDVRSLLREAEAGDRRVAVGYNLRFHPGLARLRDLLLSGAIGRPLSVRAEMGEYLPGWHPWEDYRQSYSGRSDLGGGPVLTFSHELDSVTWLLGAPDRVSCLAARASSLEIDTEDSAEITLQMREGYLASVHVDYFRRPPRRFVEITGEDGVLRWEYDDNRLLVYAPAGAEWRTELGPTGYERNQMFLDELRTFAEWVQGAPQGALADGRQGAGVLLVALTALQSAESGRTIDLTTEIGDAAEWLNSLGPKSSKPSPSQISSD